MAKCEQLLPDLWRFEDTCNVYLIRDGDRGLAIDYGSGAWTSKLEALGVRHLDHVLITHPHLDQCAGVAAAAESPCRVHAPAGAGKYLDPGQAAGQSRPPWLGGGCPDNYQPPATRVAGLAYDLAGNGHFYWQGRRVRFLDTPGHTPHACSVVVDHGGRQVVFCGDAAHAGATIWLPFSLEWDHWTGGGALAAWEGVLRLAGIDIGLLCPSHGPVVSERPRQMLGRLAARLLDFYRVKGQISAGEPDRFVPLEPFGAAVNRVSNHLYQYAGNGYLVTSESGEALVVDPHLPEMPVLEDLLGRLGGARPTASVVSHYHYDHCDGIAYLREKYGTEAWLHPLVAAPWRKPARSCLPWLLPEPIEADHLWPASGRWQWNEYRFEVAPWPGQTRGHCAFMADIDGQRVMFAGDSFTPTSKWNGTGGFCAYNDSRFEEGFAASASLALQWRPRVMAAGHNNTYYFSPSKFRKIVLWARRAEAAVRALCPSGDLEQDYYAVHGIIARQVTS